MASGSATPRAFRNAITGASRARSKRVTVDQKPDPKLFPCRAVARGSLYGGHQAQRVLAVYLADIRSRVTLFQ